MRKVASEIGDSWPGSFDRPRAGIAGGIFEFWDAAQPGSARVRGHEVTGSK
jgi:hypothetical protein